MKIFERIMKGLIVFLVLLALLVVLPLPMRCHQTAQGGQSFVPGAPYEGELSVERGLSIEGGVIIFLPRQFECYSPLRKEFWLEKSWDIKFVGLFLYQHPYTDRSWTTIHPLLAADVSKDPILMGAAHNVFVGKVIADEGVTDSSTGLRTRYSVEVTSNIKGEANGVTIVEQEGGTKGKTQYIIENASPMLEVGSTYLLATRYNESAHSYLIIAHQNAVKLLTSDQTASVGALQQLVKGDPKVRALEAAYPHEQLLEADVLHANTRNSFQSLPPEAKAVAQSRADAAKVALETMKGE